MITTILALLSSSGFGSIIGLAGGILNRKIDLSAKKDEYDYELKKLDKQKEYLQLEYDARTKIAEREAEKEESVASYNALAASYEYAKTSSKDGLVDRFSKIVRPFLTLSFFFLTMYIFYQIHLLVGQIEILPKEELVAIYKSVIEWIFFQAGVSIGWWFAMRPGKAPSFSGGK